MKHTDIAIIGAGPVGLFMAFQAGMLGMGSLIFDSLDYVGGQCSALYPEKPIYDIPGFKKILSRELVENLLEQAMQFNPQLLLGSPVIKMEKIAEEFVLENAAGQLVKAKAVVIAAGSGEFDFKKPPINGVEEFEGKSVFYSINNIETFQDKILAICGGGDSAVDWALELAHNVRHIHMIHRREKFRCHESSYKKLIMLKEQGKVTMHIPFQLENIIGEEGVIKKILVAGLEGNKKEIAVDFLLPFYGLATKLEKVMSWGVSFNQHAVIVDSPTMMTNLPGVFAIGDVCSYSGKLKLIMTGFAEAALAAHGCYKLVFPGKVLHFEHSTTKGVPELGN